MRPHTLVVSPHCEGPDRCTVCKVRPTVVYRLDCPGVDDSCVAYEECIPCSAADDDDTLDRLHNEELVHGRHHEMIDSIWCVRSEPPRCFTADADYLSAASELTVTIGRHEVTPRWEDEYIELELVEAGR